MIERVRGFDGLKLKKHYALEFGLLVFNFDILIESYVVGIVYREKYKVLSCNLSSFKCNVREFLSSSKFFSLFFFIFSFLMPLIVINQLIN